MAETEAHLETSPLNYQFGEFTLNVARGCVLKAGEEIRYLIYVKALKPGDVRFRVDIEAKELTAGPVREEAGTTIFEDVSR